MMLKKIGHVMSILITLALAGWKERERMNIPIVEAFIIAHRSSMGLYGLSFTTLKKVMKKVEMLHQ